LATVAFGLEQLARFRAAPTILDQIRALEIGELKVRVAALKVAAAESLPICPDNDRCQI
jgi:hypothetical protein